MKITKRLGKALVSGILVLALILSSFPTFGLTETSKSSYMGTYTGDALYQLAGDAEAAPTLGDSEGNSKTILAPGNGEKPDATMPTPGDGEVNVEIAPTPGNGEKPDATMPKPGYGDVNVEIAPTPGNGEKPDATMPTPGDGEVNVEIAPTPGNGEKPDATAPV